MILGLWALFIWLNFGLSSSGCLTLCFPAINFWFLTLLLCGLVFQFLIACKSTEKFLNCFKFGYSRFISGLQKLALLNLELEGCLVIIAACLDSLAG